MVETNQWNSNGYTMSLHLRNPILWVPRTNTPTPKIQGKLTTLQKTNRRHLHYLGPILPQQHRMGKLYQRPQHMLVTRLGNRKPE